MGEKIVIGFGMLLLIILTPYAITMMMTGYDKAAGEVKESGIYVDMEVDGTAVAMDLEEYMVGALAATLSRDTRLEAVKAQAVCIRTNAYRLCQQDSHLQTADLGLEYWDAEKMQSEWGQTGYDEQNQKLRYAVSATYGEVMTYQGNLIDALYHSVSIGQTVSAQELYGKDVPYLSAVDSSFDVESKDYMQMLVFDYEDVVQCVQKLNEEENGTNETVAQTTEETTTENELCGLTQDNYIEQCAVTDKTDSGYVKQVKVGTVTVSGNQFQEAFALPSLCFYMEEQDGALRIVCLGKGHGMGLSQYGANAMAKNGDSYKDILEHYYTGAELTNMSD